MANTTQLVTDTRAVADAMGLVEAAHAGNIETLSYLADVGPTTLLACKDRLNELSAPGNVEDLARIADSVDNARTSMGNLQQLALIAADAPAVRGYADQLDGLESGADVETASARAPHHRARHR